MPGVPSLSRLVATTALGDRCPGEGRFAAVSENSREPIQRSGRPGRRPSAGSKRPPGRKAPSPAGVLPAGPPQQASARTAAPWGAMACSPKPALGVTTIGSSGEQLAPGLSRSHSKGLTCGETRPPPLGVSHHRLIGSVLSTPVHCVPGAASLPFRATGGREGRSDLVPPGTRASVPSFQEGLLSKSPSRPPGDGDGTRHRDLLGGASRGHPYAPGDSELA